MGIISGAFILRSRDCIESRYSIKLGPSHQGHTSLSTRSFKLCPLYAEIGMKNKSVLGLKPFPFKKVPNRFVHSSNLSVSLRSNHEWDYLSLLHWTVGSSILLMTITNLLIPCIFARTACSLVCPPLSNPVSNSPRLALITRTPTSA